MQHDMFAIEQGSSNNIRNLFIDQQNEKLPKRSKNTKEINT